MIRIFAFGALLAAALPACALDFTPVKEKAAGEAGEYSYLRFKEDGRRILYVPPKHWEYRGSGNLFRLIPPNAPGAEIEMMVQELEKPPVASEETVADFEALAVESLPKGSDKVEVVATIFNPCEIDGRKTVEVTLSYVFFGQTFKLSRLYLPRKNDLIRFTVMTKPADFEELQRAFHSSLHTLSGL